MASFEIIGGKKLQGEVIPQGAKNEALQIVSAVLLTGEEVILENIPDIRDVMKLIELLASMGVEVEKLSEGTFKFKAANVDLEYLMTEDFKKKGGALRGSIMIIGPLLARFGKAYIPEPGGDKIGRRPVDTHLRGFEALGATFEHLKEERFYKINATNLKGAYILLDEASVTGTANI
jgi:UDP-N-acetylglucosamine 1-carboxyvinyltransferase